MLQAIYTDFIFQRNPKSTKTKFLSKFLFKPNKTRNSNFINKIIYLLKLKKVKELDFVELLPHPAYSPDRTSLDYHLFEQRRIFSKGVPSVT